MSSHPSAPPTPSPRPPRPRRGLRALGLAALLLLLRLPTLNHPWPVHGDEQEFAAALGFPRPYPVHPPGYPLWVALGALARSAGLSPYRSLQFWSILASCAAPVLLYDLLRRLRPAAADGVAWWSAAAFGLNPLWCFHAATALNYGPANCVGLAVAWCCLRPTAAPDERRPLWGALLLAVGAGLRADLLLWFGPLVVWSGGTRSRTLGWATAGCLAAGALAWSGVGAALYRDAGGPNLSHTISVIAGTSILQRGLLDGLLRNAVKLGAYLVWSFGVGTPAVGWAAAAVLLGRGRGSSPPDDSRLRTALVLWLGPVLLFQLCVHVTEVGHALWYVGPAYLMLGLALARAGDGPARKAVAVAIGLASLVQFFGYPWNATAGSWRRTVNAKVGFVSAAGLRHIDERVRIHRPGDFWPLPTPR